MSQTGNWLLRAATADDAAVMADIHRRAFAAPWDAETLAAFLTAPGGYGLLAATAGFILCRVAAGEGEVLTLAVDPDHRGRGCGRALMEAAAVHTGAAGAVRLVLEVAEDNPSARALYRRCGFVRVGRRRRYYRDEAGGGAVDALVLARPV